MLAALAFSGASWAAAATLSWRDNADNEDGFVIERAGADLVFAPIGSVGANVTTYDDRTAEPAKAHYYRVAAFNDAGTSAYTKVAGTAEDDPATSHRLSNLSTRAAVGAGEDVLITGFVVTGTARKELLIRGAGPALGRFGLDATLPDPVLTVLDGAGRLAATNDDWSGMTTPDTLVADAGGFPFSPGSRDSALRVTVGPGAYTVQVADGAGRTGMALAEIYELDGTPARLANLSARAFVGGREAATVVAGFVVKGRASGRYLIRAVGPSLARFGVSGFLPDPLLTITSSSGAEVAVNDNWSSVADDVTAANQSVAAFPLLADSRDAAAVIRVSDGAYTVEVSAVGGAAGVALVEIYELPD